MDENSVDPEQLASVSFSISRLFSQNGIEIAQWAF